VFLSLNWKNNPNCVIVHVYIYSAALVGSTSYEQQSTSDTNICLKGDFYSFPQ